MLPEYLQKTVDKAVRYAKRDVLHKLYTAFNKAGYDVSLSHDSANTTERRQSSARAFCNSFDSRAEQVSTIWVFVYHKGTYAKAAEPLYWVRLEADNGAYDLISDYTARAENIVKPVSEYANKYC